MVKENQQCISCGAGHYYRVLQDITLDTQHGRKVTIPAVEVFKCRACGDEVIPAASHNYIDRRIADEDEQLSPADVRKSFDALGDSLTEISQAIGIGSKTPGRWLSGSQHPTKALGLYLRVLAAYPEAYKWLKEQGWKAPEENILQLTFGPDGKAMINGHAFDQLEQPTAEGQPPWAKIGNFARQFCDTPYRPVRSAIS